MTLEITAEGADSPKFESLSKYIRPDGLILPDGLSKDEFYEVFYQVKLMKKFGSHWVRECREYGVNNFDEEFVDDTEDKIDTTIAKQFQLALGLSTTEETAKPQLNSGLGKGTAIVTIEGVHQLFSIWHRKMADAICEWNPQDRKKACELLRPMVEFYDSLIASQEGK